MMTNINKLVSPIRDSITDLFTTGVDTCGQLAGRTVNYLQHLPTHMQQNQHVAVTIFALSNAVFFTLINVGANSLNNRIERYAEELSKDGELAKNIIVDGFLVGGAVTWFNYNLAKITQCAFADQRINAALLTVVTIAAVVARTFLIPKTAVDKKEDLDVLKDDVADIVADKPKESETVSPKTSPSKDSSYQADIEECKAAIAKLKETLATKQKIIDGSQSVKDALTTALKSEAALKEALAEAKEDLKKLQKELKNAKSTMSSEKSQANEKITAHKTEITLLKEKLAEKEKEINALQASIKSLETNVANLKDTVLKFSEDEEAAKAALALANKEIKGLKISLAERQNALENLQSQYDAKDFALKAKEEELSSTQKELASAIKDAENTKAALEAKETEFNSLNITLKNTLSNLQRTKTGSDEKTKEIDALRKRLATPAKPKQTERPIELNLEDRNSSDSHSSENSRESMGSSTILDQSTASGLNQSTFLSPRRTRADRGVYKPKQHNPDYIPNSRKSGGSSTNNAAAAKKK